MRLHAYQPADSPLPAIGVLEDGRVLPLTSLPEFYADVPGWLRRAAAGQGPAAARPGGTLVLSDLTPAVPVPQTAKIICVALNYPMHAAESGVAVSERPNLFARWYATLVTDGTPVPVPEVEPGLDWEVELAVVVGAPMHALAPADVPAGILGYTVFNDISARTHQYATGQWATGKNADRSGPIGSTIVSADAVDPDDLGLGTLVNGAVMQDGRTSEMVVKIPDLLAYAAQTMTLRPGDVIATGTPAGVGHRRQPPVYLRPGDTVEVHVDGVGSLRNPIVAP